MKKEKLEDSSMYKISKEDFKEFTQAQSYVEQLKILKDHSIKNKKRIEIRRKKEMENTEKELEQEVKDVNDQFVEFLKTKGIKAKFKIAFANMKESAKEQHEQDKANFEAVKKKSAEDNKEFVEFLHTKGFKAKVNLVIENIKKGAKESRTKTKEQIAKVNAQTKANIANAGKVQVNPQAYTAETLADEFNAFLKSKGLDSKYTVVITEE